MLIVLTVYGLVDFPGLLNLGYVKGRTIVGAPYDFRYAPHSQNDYFDRLKALIERTTTENNGARVILIAHSMGGLFMHSFLRQQVSVIDILKTFI